MSSALDRFRRPGALPVEPRHEPEVTTKQTGDGTKAATQQGPESEDYEKLPTRYRQHCLEIRPLRGFCEYPAYAQLIDFFADHPENPSILLIWFMPVLVIVRGANMKDHLAGLHQRTLWIIEQHAAPPENPKSLYVESIEFVRENIPATLALLLGEKKPKERQTA